MKIITKKYVVMIVIGAVCSLFGSNAKAQADAFEDYSKRILGTWELDFSKTLKADMIKSKQKYDGLEKDKRDQIKDTFDKQSIKFEADGKYSLKSKVFDMLNGKWSLKEDSLSILLESGEEMHMQIIELTDEVLKFDLGMDDVESALFKELTYNRKK